MRLLVDSNVLLFTTDAPGRLSAVARRLMTEPGHSRMVSSATFWEMAIKFSIGKWRPSRGLEQIIAEQERALHLTELAITKDHILRLAGLPLLHRDPFDRMLIAQALAEGFPIVTSDRRFAAYGVDVIW